MSKARELIEKLNSKNLNEDHSHPQYPQFPYERGKGRITQLAKSEKLHLAICKIAGGNFFITDKNKRGIASTDGVTFSDKYPNFRPTKETGKIRSAHNTTYNARVDLTNRKFAIDIYNTKTGQYLASDYYTYADN